MSKFSKAPYKIQGVPVSKLRESSVKNFMGGVSYTLNPLDTLRIVASSSIFGEPSYYEDSHDRKSAVSLIDKRYAVFPGDEGVTTTDRFVTAVHNALSEDFKATLSIAVELRTEYLMRLNPALIMVLASMHPDRVKFNAANPGVFTSALRGTVLRPDDITNQLDLYIFINGSKNNLPNVMKRAWAGLLGGFTAYQMNKYKSKSLIDLVRISHAKGELVNELCRTGGVAVPETGQTWEKLRSEGKTWVEILNTIKMPHMALLRNLRGIFTTTGLSSADANKVLTYLINGVANGKQFPYRYYSAYKAISVAAETMTHRQLVLDALSKCVDEAVANFPKLKGRTISLSDNSGSAWGTLNTEYGSTTVGEISNLSAIITGLQAETGEVAVFGDRIEVTALRNRDNILGQVDQLNQLGKKQGGGTENGLWLFFRDAIAKGEVYDNIFIYSDQQAGTGGLYGVNASDYSDYIYGGNNMGYNSGRHIDLLKLVDDYRKKVNPKVNIFSVQVAGYDNIVIPENMYRGALLYGWTGREVTYAKAISDVWDSVEGRVHDQAPVEEKSVLTNL
jgi:60 kDa SS-A/Ro ribonucleoprotein